MIARTPLVPVHSMAFELAHHPRAAWADAEAARRLLQARHYGADDARLGVAEAVALADALLAAAAAETAWARGLGYARDVLAVLVFAGFGIAYAFGWAVLP